MSQGRESKLNSEQFTKLTSKCNINNAYSQEDPNSNELTDTLESIKVEGKIYESNENCSLDSNNKISDVIIEKLQENSVAQYKKLADNSKELTTTIAMIHYTEGMRNDSVTSAKLLATESEIINELSPSPKLSTGDINIEEEKIGDSYSQGHIFGDNGIKKPRYPVRQQPVYPQQQGQAGYYPQQGQQGQYGQTPYYQQQVAGQNVYTTGPPPPVDATRGAMMYPRQTDQPQYNQMQNEQYNVIFTSTFDSTRIRNRFIQRVYTILSMMLTLTTAIICLCIFEPHCKQYLLGDMALMIGSAVVFFAMYIVLMCFEKTRRMVPLNFVLLTVLTISMAIMSGVLSAQYQTHVVLMTMGITCAVVILVSVFACQTSFDMTGCGMYLYVATAVIFLFGIIAMFVAMFTGLRIIMVVYSGLCALLFCMYLVYDTQCIVGGRRYELSPEEYIAGAIMLYVDIMYIFIYLLQIIGYSSN